MSVINTNITSLIGQSNLSKSQNALQTSMERLSSGLRINSAKDDAAGQAIANRMTAQINGLAQAQRNANDGISVAQTAEGALNQVNDNLQRIRELSVQAQNGTNSANDLQSIQDEITQRLSEIDRISGETNFNGVEVLNTDDGLTIQVGANDDETISVNLQTINAETLGLSDFSVQKAQDVEVSAALTEITEGDAPAGETTAPSYTFNVTLPANSTGLTDTPTGYIFDSYVTADDKLYAKFTEDGGAGLAYFEIDPNTEVDATDGSVTAALDTDPTNADLIAAPAGEQAVTTFDVERTLDNGSNLTAPAEQTFSEYVTNDQGELFAKFEDNATNEVYYYAIPESDINDNGEVSTNLSAAAADYTADELNLTAGAGVPAGATFHEVQNEDGEGTGTYVIKDGDDIYLAELDTTTGEYTIQQAEYEDEQGDTQTANVRFGGIDGETAYATVSVERDGEMVDVNFAVNENQDGSFTVDLENEIANDATADPLAALDEALNKVDVLRSELGAVQNRFEDAITNLNTNETNLAAARSRIEDADYAVEVANMTRAQILQQAGTSVLAQANQIPQNVLSLLG